MVVRAISLGKLLVLLQQQRQNPTSAKDLPLNMSVETAPDDNELLKAIGSGDRQAFAVLMRRHLSTMAALAQRITMNMADTDEVTQEAFLRVWRHAAKWDPNGNAEFRTWIYRVTTNLAIDRCRRPKSLPLEAAGDPPDDRDDPECLLSRSEETVLVRTMLLRLPARQRAAVTLCYLEDRSNAEAAKILSISTGAVEALLVRARHGLRTVIKALGRQEAIR